VLSLVDNRTFKRLFFQVLDHDPTQDDVIAFFRRFQDALQTRQLKVFGITTDGSDLYPGAIRVVWLDVPHQLCEFHVLKDLNLATLHAVAQVRKDLTAQLPKLGGADRPPPHVPSSKNASGSSRKSVTCLNIVICSCNIYLMSLFFSRRGGLANLADVSRFVHAGTQTPNAAMLTERARSGVLLLG
jgi:hypothetical protein